MNTETTITGSLHVNVTLPVQYRMTDGTPFDVRIAGMNSLFDLMPEEVRLQILRAIRREARDD